MNYEVLLALARKDASEDAANMHPPGPARNEMYRWLVVKNYLDFISPIQVGELLDMLP